MDYSTEFVAGKRIYYIFMTEVPLHNCIRVKVFKRERKADFYPTDVVYSNDFRVNKDQIYYYSDYIVINEAGTYCMMIYSKDDLNHFMAIADFKVKNP